MSDENFFLFLEKHTNRSRAPARSKFPATWNSFAKKKKKNVGYHGKSKLTTHASYKVKRNELFQLISGFVSENID